MTEEAPAALRKSLVTLYRDCSGILVDLGGGKTVVLTARHCIKSSYRASVGFNNFRPSGDNYKFSGKIALKSQLRKYKSRSTVKRSLGERRKLIRKRAEDFRKCLENAAGEECAEALDPSLMSADYDDLAMIMLDGQTPSTHRAIPICDQVPQKGDTLVNGGYGIMSLDPAKRKDKVPLNYGYQKVIRSIPREGRSAKTDSMTWMFSEKTNPCAADSGSGVFSCNSQGRACISGLLVIARNNCQNGAFSINLSTSNMKKWLKESYQKLSNAGGTSFVIEPKGTN